MMRERVVLITRLANRSPCWRSWCEQKKEDWLERRYEAFVAPITKLDVVAIVYDILLEFRISKPVGVVLHRIGVD